MIVYISIGNSDDKLTQRRWQNYQLDVKELLSEIEGHLHGEWFSSPTSLYQNCCWCVEFEDRHAPELKGRLAAAATIYRQDAISWAEAPQTEFLGEHPHTLNHPGSDRWTGGDKKDAA